MQWILCLSTQSSRCDKDPDTKNMNNDDNGQTSFIESESEFEYRTYYINDKVELVEAET